MSKGSPSRTVSCEDDPDSLFWDSQLYHKSYFKNRKNKGFSYYDETSVLKYLFFHWVNRWVSVLSKKYIEPYKLHPLQISDQVLKWEPIFSKHISDGLVRLDLYEANKSSKKPVRSYRSILLRAILLTSWKKSIVLFLGLVVGNVLSMSISILVKKFLQILTKPSIHLAKNILLLLVIIAFHILDGLLLENVNYYLYRMIYVLYYLYGTVPYRHSLSHRRVYYNNINGSNQLNVCNQVLHSCDPDSQCSKNPLFCPALRYQSKEVTPKIFTYVFYDSFYIAMAFESTKFIVQFLTNFIYGAYLMSRHVKANLWVLYLVGCLFLFFMVVIEIFNAVIFKYILYMRDYKVTKYNDILGSLSIIKKMLIDDIGFNIITQTRNDELSLIFIKIFITFVNMCLFSTSINVSFYIIKRYFVKSVDDANVVTDINPAAFLATFYIYMRIVSSMFIIPRSINIIGMAYVSYKRVNSFLKNCSPNFYNKANCFTGSVKASTNITSTTNKIAKDVVIYYKDATFAWVNTRDDLLNKNYEPFLKNINFELRRKEMAIVTGVLGSGKSNFIKSILGEMTLVGGSMAVVPLHTSMPIFYASEDIFLQQGTIRSNITFGYMFDENLYDTVLKAVELEFDISTWEKGDLRVVSDNAHSLSGGQRVRMELARALYAYLIFHQVNSDYNNNKCSFLMCLDSPFQGLDPYVSKSIFNNLFNIKTGLLVKDDLSVVLTTSKQGLDISSKTSNLTQIPNVPVYEIKDANLNFYAHLHDFVRNKKTNVDFNYLSPLDKPYHMNSLTNDMLSLCSSGSTSRLGRVETTKELYKESFAKYIKEHFGNTKFNPYFVFMRPALVTFAIYILLTVALNAMDYIQFILSSRLSDYIIKNINDHSQGTLVDIADVKLRSNYALRFTVIFVSVIITLSFLATLAISAASLISCRKLHEYSLNTIFNYSSSVVKIKKQISQVITFLSCDLMMTDDITGLFIALVLFSLIQTITNLITLFYVIPITIPFIVVTMMVAYFYVLRRYVQSARNLNFGFLESVTQLNSIIERSILGSEIYRSFNRDSELLIDFLEHRDYSARSKFLFAGVVSWSTIVFTWMFSLITFIILVIPIILDKYTKYKMMVGYYGLALSLSMNVVESFNNFSFMYACTQQLMGSIERFRYFIPLGKKLKFDKCPNTHEEHLINPSNKGVNSLDKNQLLKRRAIEFKSDNKRFYGLRRLFYRPKISIIDVSTYLSAEHTGVELNDVCVYTTPELNSEGMILKHLTVSAHKSEIIGMVGRTGAGKTTLLSVLQNISANRTGQVLLDGKDMNDIPKVVLRQIIGVLPQLPFVFKGWTVRRFLDPRKLFSDAEINIALNQCGLLEFVNTMPGSKGLDGVIISDGGIFNSYLSKVQSNFKDKANKFGESSKSSLNTSMLLTNSQIRTLMFARLVLYRNFFRVIIVDEPPEEDPDATNSKKDDLAVPIYDLLIKYFGHCTTFVTAHDVNVLRKCSYVWALHQGSLVRTCRTCDLKENESISKIIEECVKYSISWSPSRTVSCEDDPDSLFWDSQLYHKSYFKNRKNKGFSYYDETSVLKYLFFHWVNRWVSVLSKKYIEPYKLHPLQISDQVLKWEPIFSKHISDGLVRLDVHGSTKKSVNPYRSILLRAILLTSWKKSIVLFLGLVVGNVLSMSISILVKKFLQILTKPSIHLAKNILLLLVIIAFHILDGLLLENINFYVYRMIYTLHYLYGIVPYRHSLSHRRVYYNNINGSNQLNVCNQVLHSCDPDSQCSKNPLFCPALRYQSKEVTPKIFTYVFYDSFNIAMAFESTKFVVQFLTNFIYGAYLMSRHVKANLWVLYLVGCLFLFFMVSFEIFNAYIFRFILFMRDYKVTKYNDILGSLSIIKKMLIDDIGFNIITQTRNDELSLIFIKIFITFVNMFLYSTTINISFYIIKMYFVRSVNNAGVVTDINTAAFMTTFYIYMRIVTSMFLIPRAINIVGMSYISYKRLNKYLSGCPPNFYAADNKFVGSTQTSAVLTDVTSQIPNDTLVYYKDATFAWVNTRDDLLNKNYEPFLKNINFELRRKEMAIVTGVLGSGKSNFIKSILGEMTLVGGSMAVVPLHTSMPIFYASEDIFLQQGTIRSNITFGYKFDEHLYDTVLRAVELDYDISTWEKGDLRVVSDNAHSLSGGQRVRVEMARAVYAYLVFHKVNKEYNNSQCSFLMCLDSSFHGLDPYVSKTVFNNLFNLKNGLLIKDDLSVVLTTSKQILDTCIKACEPAHFQNTPIYNIKNKELKFFSNLHDFMKNNKQEGDFKYLTSARTGPYTLNGLTNDMLGLCLYKTSGPRRAEINKKLYQESFVKYIKEHFGNTKFNPYFVFMRPALVTFAIYILLTVSLNILDYVKFVLSTNLSDYITKNINEYKDGQLVNLDVIKLRSNSALNVTIIFVSVIIILSFLATVALTAGSLVSSRKIHEYCINTIFNYSSSVVKIKKQISQVITFLSGDLMMTDDITGFNISLVLLSFIQAATNIITLFYLIPMSIPFILLTLVVIYIYILKRYINTAVALNFGFMESLAQMNSVIVRSISGGSVYRSFNRNSDLLRDFLEHRDYNARTKFLFAAGVSWSTILFTWIFPLTTFIILVIPIILDKYTKYKITIGYFGLALSLCTNVNKSFSDFSFMYACTRMVISSIERFRYFIPLGKKLKFDKCPNTHEEHLINPSNKGVNSLDKNQLLKRRAIEFKSDNKRFYGLRRLFYRPKISIIDVSTYLSAEHTGVELNDVCVYTTPELNSEGMILKHLTVSAHKSEIIGMVGRTGAGKTTLLSVLQNISANRTGQVLLDGKDMNDIPKVVLRQIIGVLPQLPFVFKGWTVRRFLDPRKLFSDAEINIALNQCGLLEFVNELPAGKKLDTVLAPEEPLLYYKKPGAVNPITLEYMKSKSLELAKSGVDNELLLSYNQLRTLSLARLVLYRHFYRMIVVDEPPEEDVNEEASARKDDLEVPIYELLQKHFSHCTTFVTAHDVNVLKSCTSVWVIHEGRLVKTCKASDVSANESIASIIEQNVKRN
ncbi:hypothetical protein MACK_003693 [Theileria orientalis]|uniref:ABC transporter n=1 Tax=Theileria orientalis TaxID=68886 RepID=A0A976XK08_THEOR|nr:hypothetical protein MACK_003693 [Theileria orientalis]